MDFTKIGFDTLWENETNSKNNSRKAIIYACIFAFSSVNLLISIVRTISTHPGNIPEEREWDMSTDT